MSIPIKPKKGLSKECNRLRRLIAFGIKHGEWTIADECATKIGLSPGTFNHHVRDRTVDKKCILASAQKVENYLREKKVIKGPLVKKAHTINGPPQEIVDSLQRIESALRNLETKQPQTDDVIVSPVFDRILSGVFALAGQEDQPIRFVLRAGTFRKLKGAVTGAEVNDTKLLLTELRRRLTLFAQLDDKHQRQQLFQGLAAEIDHLYVAIRQLEQVVPTDAAKHLDELSQARKLGSKLFTP